MARSLSAKKRVRQNLKKRVHNKQIRTKVRTEVKSVRQLIDRFHSAAGEPAKGDKTRLNDKVGQVTADISTIYSSLRNAFKVLDKAAGSGVIHKNKASRLKSRLNLALNKITKT